MLAGLLAWSLLDAPLSQAFRGLCSLTLAPLTFGAGGHVAFAAAPLSSGVERADSWDVRMLLSIEGVSVEHAIALNPRRLLYLPLLTLFASVAAMPLTLRKRQRALLVGSALLVALALSSVWLIAVFLFAQVPGLVYSLSPAQNSVLRLVYEGWVTPLSNKFIVPLLLAYGLFAWQRGVPSHGEQSEPARDATKSHAESLRKPAKVRPEKRDGAKRNERRRRGAPSARRS